MTCKQATGGDKVDTLKISLDVPGEVEAAVKLPPHEINKNFEKSWPKLRFTLR
jgi:hypothetical protein